MGPSQDQCHHYSDLLGLTLVRIDALSEMLVFTKAHKNCLFFAFFVLKCFRGTAERHDYTM